MKNILFCVVMFFTANVVFAETIKLKSGKVVEGKIVQLNEDEIRIDKGIGVLLTYYRDEIESIDSKPLASVDPKDQRENETKQFIQGVMNATNGEKSYYPTGELMSEGNRFDGNFRKYYKNGKVAIEGNFKNMQPWNGLFRVYAEDGTLKLEENYREGVLLDKDGKPYNGIVKKELANRAFEVTSFKNGKIDGMSKTYFENGNIQSESIWENGKLNGYTTVYDKNGAIRGKFFYKDGQMVTGKKEQ